MMILLLRHGLTAGNLEKRYIGRTDEPLCREGVMKLQALRYPRCSHLICSPMQRCVQTADILFPGQAYRLHPGLRECDFGDFEGKNYIELSGNADYQRWIDSGGTLPFPNGEAPAAFRKRCTDAFTDILSDFERADSAAFLVHGGTIMAILEKYAVPRKDYFDWQCPNGHGYLCDWDGTEITITETI